MDPPPTTRFNSESLPAVPRFVQYTSPVSTARQNDDRTATTLPLNIVALITQHIDDIADLARITRTCRLLYYMTLPNLYERVSLHSYPEIRYINGRPEGYGSGSPFTMALNGLVTKNHGQLVEDFRVWGAWREMGQEDFAKGRVPDNSMMLNTLLRAATDKMAKLKSFSWELDCKPLKTLYQGLATHNCLTSLTIRFPTSRIPRPSVMIPPMANLRAFKAIDIDPLCYPDDVSMLFLHSRRLEDIRLHFSPRMRREAEPTVSLETYFGSCTRAGYQIPLKHFALQNYFGMKMDHFPAWNIETCRSVAFIDTFGGIHSGSRNVFIDDTWRDIPNDMRFKFKRTRTNEVASQHVRLLERNEVGMEQMYFVNAKHSTSPEYDSPVTPGDSPPSDEEMAQLGKEYLNVLTRKHGQTLTHLLLREEWALTPEDVSDIIRFCPNLEQFGLALDSSNHSVLRLLMPFLPKIKALRILGNESLSEHLRTITHEERMAMMGADMAKAADINMQFVGLADIVYRVGKLYAHIDDNGKVEMRREVVLATPEEYKHLDIWAVDCLDISADPLASFEP